MHSTRSTCWPMVTLVNNLCSTCLRVSIIISTSCSPMNRTTITLLISWTCLPPVNGSELVIKLSRTAVSSNITCVKILAKALVLFLKMCWTVDTKFFSIMVNLTSAWLPYWPKPIWRRWTGPVPVISRKHPKVFGEWMKTMPKLLVTWRRRTISSTSSYAMQDTSFPTINRVLLTIWSLDSSTKSRSPDNLPLKVNFQQLFVKRFLISFSLKCKLKNL